MDYTKGLDECVGRLQRRLFKLGVFAKKGRKIARADGKEKTTYIQYSDYLCLYSDLIWVSQKSSCLFLFLSISGFMFLHSFFNVS